VPRSLSLSLFRSRSLQVLLTESSHSFGGVGCFLLWARGQVPRTKKQVLAQTKGPYFSCDVLLLHTLALAARLVFKNSALPEISRVLILPLGLTHTHTRTQFPIEARRPRLVPNVPGGASAEGTFSLCIFNAANALQPFQPLN
jgi:hypothetical protein